MLKLDLVSPEGQAISSREASSLTVPAANGEINILPGHVDIVCTLGKGQMVVDDKDRFVIFGGILEVSGGGTVTIAADRIRSTQELDPGKLRSELAAIENRLLNEDLNDADYNVLMSEYEDVKAEMSSINGI